MKYLDTKLKTRENTVYDDQSRFASSDTYTWTLHAIRKKKMRITKNSKGLIKRTGVAFLIGVILSFCSNLIFTLVLRKNNLPPFYHGGISPNYFEIILIAIIPVTIFLILATPKSGKLPFEVLSYCLICSLGILGWAIGIYEQTTFKMIDDPNDTFFLGSLGKFEWHLRQKCFLIGILTGITIVFLVNRIRLK